MGLAKEKEYNTVWDRVKAKLRGLAPSGIV